MDGFLRPAACSSSLASSGQAWSRPGPTRSKSFLLPEDIDEDDITATFEYGQLKVSVPRPKVETPRTIEITTSR